MSISEDTLKETKTSRLHLEALGYILHRIYIVGILILVTITLFGCIISFDLIRMLK